MTVHRFLIHAMALMQWYCTIRTAATASGDQKLRGVVTALIAFFGYNLVMFVICSNRPTAMRYL